jgi:hypothetical protein
MLFLLTAEICLSVPTSGFDVINTGSARQRSLP